MGKNVKKEADNSVNIDVKNKKVKENAGKKNSKKANKNKLTESKNLRDVEKKKNKLSTTAIALISTGAVFLLIAIIVATVFLVDAIKKDKFFDYLKSDLSKYVTLAPEVYKDYPIEIDIAKPHDIDVDVAILNLLASDKGNVQNDGKLITSSVTITPGDVVNIWYRGYRLDENGKEVFTSGMCNFSSAEAASLEIGSGQFVPGFELGLVNKVTGDYPKFVKITEGEIKDTQFAYVTYSRLVEGGSEKTDKKTGSYVRIDLSDESIDDTYGKGFREAILAATIGEKESFSVTIDGKTHNYSDTVVNFVTECEVDPLVVECYFPYDYSSTILRNETAYFEVYVESVQEYECPEFNDEYVKKIVNEKDAAITEAELAKYEGATLTEKYRAFAEETIYKAYEENYKSMVEDAMWDYYLEKAQVKKYPAIKVDEIYQEYVDDVYYQFDQTGGSIQNQYTEEYENFDNIDDFAVAYLGLTYSENQDWKAVLYTMSENLVKERLVMYYLMREEGITPTKAELEAELAKIKEEYIDEYVKQYLEHEGKTREDYDDAAYATFVEDRKAELFDYYDEDYFTETAYYEIALRTFITWPKVSTLDDRSAAPQVK